MSDYAYIDEDHRLRDDRITAIEAKSLYSKKDAFLCACGIKVHLCYGEILTDPYFAPFSKDEKHKKIDGKDCPCMEAKSIRVGKTKYKFKELFINDKRDPSLREINAIDQMIRKEQEEPSPSGPDNPVFPPDNGPDIETGPVDPVFPPGNTGPEQPVDPPVVFGPDDEFGGIDVNDKDLIRTSLLSLYKDAEGGEKNNMIYIYGGGEISAYDLVVNRNTIRSHIKKQGIGPGYKLVHCYRTAIAKEFGYPNNTLFFRDDISNEPASIYFEVFIENNAWFQKFRELITTKFNNYSLHFYIFGEWENVSRGGLTIYRTNASFRTFKIEMKKKKNLSD